MHDGSNEIIIMHAKKIFQIFLISFSAIVYSTLVQAENKAAIDANEALLEKLVCAEYLNSRDLRSIYREALPPSWKYHHQDQKTVLLFGEAPLSCGGFGAGDVAILNSLEKNAPQLRDEVIKPLAAGKKANEIDTQYFIKAVANYPSAERVKIIPSDARETNNAHVTQTKLKVHEYVLLALKKSGQSVDGEIAPVGSNNGTGTSASSGSVNANGNGNNSNDKDSNKDGANGALSAIQHANENGSNNSNSGIQLPTVGANDNNQANNIFTRPSNGNGSNNNPGVIPTNNQHTYPPVTTPTDDNHQNNGGNGSGDGDGSGKEDEDSNDAIDVETGFEQCTAENPCDDMMKDTVKDAYQNQMALAVNPSPAYTYRNQPGYKNELNDRCVGDSEHCQKSESGWTQAVQAAQGKTPAGNDHTAAKPPEPKKVKLCSFLGYKLPCRIKG
jgi:hypothetical protein